MLIVLQKALAQAGVASRRHGEEMILAGRVWVNGEAARKLGTRVDVAKDKITVDKKPILFDTELVYYLLNKPKGVVATTSDTHRRDTVVDMIPTTERIVPVGRLDINTTGLLILTNDGDLVYKLTHPKFANEKEYEALIQVPQTWDKARTAEMVKKFVQGVYITGGFKTSPAKVSIISQKTNDRYLVSIIIHEGHKHQVRQMINAIGASVVELKRTRMGTMLLGDLPVGQWRKLNAEEIQELKKSTA